MGDDTDGTVDKIYLVPPSNYTSAASVLSSTEAVPEQQQQQQRQETLAFDMKYREAHLQQLYALFPHEKSAIDEFIRISNLAMLYVKFFIFARLMPKW